MNKITFAGRTGADEERANKSLEVLIADGVVTVVPPYCGQTVSEGLRIFIEQPLTNLKSVCVLRGGEADGIKFAAEQAEIFFGQGGRGEAVLDVLGDLLISYINLYAVGGKEYSPVVKTVFADVEKNISNASYSLEDALKKLPLNYDYVRKLFKKETGATPHEYLISKRMGLAASLISSGVSNKYSDYTVAQIAEACGFAEPLYFSRVFKKFYGVAPSEYGKN